MTDEQLINRFLGGEIAAFNTLVWRWETCLYNFALRYLGDRDAAREVCQRTFVRVHARLHHLRDASKLSTWLHQIVLNLCRDENRRQVRRKTVALQEIEKNGTCAVQAALLSKDDPEAEACRENLNELLNKALQLIPEEQRAVIILKQYRGMKFREIADLMKISESTAKSRMYYGLVGLRTVFEKWQIDKESLMI